MSTVLNPTRLYEWTEIATTIDADRAREYAAAIGEDVATRDPVLPVSPVYAVAIAVPAWADAMQNTFQADPYTLGSVHGEQDLVLHGPLLPGARLRIRAAVVGVHPKSTGTLVLGRAEAYEADRLIVEQYFVNFFRGVAVSESMGELPREHQLPDTVRSQSPIAQVTYAVDMEQGVRYAYASGDMGIYHLDDAAARTLGFPRRIVHGVCTMAIAGRAVTAALCERDSQRLRRLAVRFSAPLLPGQNVTTTMWPLRINEFGFEVVDESGTRVITNGLAVITP